MGFTINLFIIYIFLEGRTSKYAITIVCIIYYFTDFLPIEEKRHTIEEKAHALCYYLQNQKLVAYYQQFGLQPNGASDPYMTTMKGNISNVVKTCDAQLGRKRRKLRKFRKSKQIKKSKSKCKCWTGYERVKDTMPCAKKSCRKI